MSKNLLKIILPGFIFFLALIGSLAVGLPPARAINDSGVVYPVKELGDCADKAACKKYCDISSNQGACLDFAQSRGMMAKEDVDQAKKVLRLAEQGVATPGNCQGQEECDAYCSDSAHLDECVAFGEAAGIMTKEEVQMIKKTGGKGPGGCQGKKACDAYCQDEANLDTCISFAEQNGLMTAQEKEMTKKTGGKGPGGCRGKAACDAYCQQESNFDSCLEFGRQYGSMTEEEYQMAKKMGPKMMSQGGPGGCKGKEECDAFCKDEKNFDACLDFGKENGMMSEEEYAMAKKMGAKAFTQGGPGGCKSKEECEGYCNNPAHSEACIAFAQENGLMSQEEIEKMKQGGFMVPPGGNGDFMGPGGCKTQEECMAFCSQKENDQLCRMFGAGPQIQMSEDSFSGGRPGPGGCSSPQECMTFCSERENQQLCMEYRPPERVTPPPEYHEGDDPNKKQTGPGGCDSPEACEAYCSAHREECGAPPSGGDQGPVGPGEPGPYPTGDPYPPKDEGPYPPGPGPSGEPYPTIGPPRPIDEDPYPPRGEEPPTIEPPQSEPPVERQPIFEPTVPVPQEQYVAPQPQEQAPLPPPSEPAPQAEQAPPPPPPAESAPQASNSGLLIASILNFLSSATSAIFGK